MQIKKLAVAGLGSLVALLGTPSFAAMSMPCGWFIEGGWGSSHQHSANYPGYSSTSGSGVTANVGYKFMPFFALQANYTTYADAKIKDQFGTKAGTDSHYSYGLVGKGMVPLAATGVEAFGLLGISRINSHITVQNGNAAANIGLVNSHHNANGLFLGVGAQYYFIPEVGIVGQWTRAQGSNSTGDLDLFSIGLNWIVG